MQATQLACLLSMTCIPSKLKCLIIKRCLPVCPQVKPWWPHSDMQHVLAHMRDGILSWRDKLLCPWKYKRIYHSDGDLEKEVDKAFRLVGS